MAKDIDSYKVWTAVITPMNHDGSVDYDSMEKLLHAQESAGNAITILGSTGEALNIDLDERKQILDFALNLNLKVPIMAGVGGINLNDQKAWINYLNKLSIDAYLLVVPLYAKPGVHGQYGWFKELLDISAKKCMLYNVPGRTAKILEYEAVNRLKDHPDFWAIKEASGSENDFAKYKKVAPNIKMMSGDDPMLPAFSKLGAEGVVSVAANAWPKATNIYAEQCSNGTFKDHKLWDEATKALFVASNPIPVKALMHKIGKIGSATVRLPLSAEDMVKLEYLVELDQKIKMWQKSNE